MFFRKGFLVIGALFLLAIFFSGGRASFFRNRVLSQTAFVSSIFSRGSAAVVGLWRTSDIERDDRIRLFADAGELTLLRQENEKLRATLRIGEATQKKVISARITGIGREIGDEYIMIDKGADDGIAPDFTVLGGEKLLLGRAVEVFARASRVRLLSSPQEVTEASILPSGIRAVSRGMQSGELSLDLVPRESDVSVGDAVITAEQSRYGGGWVVGEVVDIDAPDNEVFQTILVRHLFDPFSGTVFVVVP